jgi:outer membrane protein
MRIGKWLFSGLMVGVLMLVSGAACWAASPKIGYFDIQTILDKSKWGQQAKNEFVRKKDQVKANMDLKAKNFKALREEYEKKAPMLDEAARTKKARDLLEKQQEGEKALLESNAELNKLSNELTGPIVDKILEIVINIGKKEKFDMILEVEKGGIVYAKDDYNLTNRVIDELNKTTPKK